jgi:hypothetical protein
VGARTPDSCRARHFNLFRQCQRQSVRVGRRGQPDSHDLGARDRDPFGDDTYLARLKALREQRDAIVERTAPGLPGHRAVEWLRALGESFQAADVPKEKADPMHA